MLKTKSYGYSLGPLQKDIIKCLAEEGPQTINEIKSNLKRHYHSTHTAFSSLREKHIVKEVAKKSYRGREFERFWLTSEGILMAVTQKANVNKLRKHAKIVHGEKIGAFLDFKQTDELVEFYCIGRVSGRERFIMLLPIQTAKDSMMPWIRITLPKDEINPFTGKKDHMYFEMHAFPTGKPRAEKCPVCSS